MGRIKEKDKFDEILIAAIQLGDVGVLYQAMRHAAGDGVSYRGQRS